MEIKTYCELALSPCLACLACRGLFHGRGHGRGRASSVLGLYRCRRKRQLAFLSPMTGDLPRPPQNRLPYADLAFWLYITNKSVSEAFILRLGVERVPWPVGCLHVAPHSLVSGPYIAVGSTQAVT